MNKKSNSNKVKFSNIFKINSYTKTTQQSEKKQSNFINKESIPFNYKVLVFLLFVIISIGIIIFYLNPFQFLNYIQIPIIIFYLLVIFCILIFIERYTRDTNVIDKNSIAELQVRFIGFITSYFSYIIILVIISIVSYFIINYLKIGAGILLNRSLPLTIGLVILILALFSNYSKNHTIDNPILDLIKDIIMYIPCLLTDAIDFIKKDYENTPSSVIIVFVVLIIYCLTFYILPIVKKEMYKKDGVLLIEKPVYLNKNNLNLTTGELRDKIFDSMPFYDRWVQNMLYSLYEDNITVDYSTTDISNVDISFSYPIVIDRDYIVPPDRKTKVFYENFTSLMNHDTIPLTVAYNSLNQIENAVLSILTTNDPTVTEDIKKLNDKPEQLKEYIRTVIQNEPYLLSFVEKLGIIYASSLATRDGILRALSDEFRPINKEPRVYRYSISMWVYLNPIEKTPIQQVIMSYGSLPSLYYNSNNSVPTLTLEYKDYSDNNNGKSKILYKTRHILYQRWNHIVITYNYGTVDLFINNNLVGNYKNVSPFIYDHDLLIIGSNKNKNIGGICNVKYYPSPISANKIQSIYNQFNNKEEPI